MTARRMNILGKDNLISLTMSRFCLLLSALIFSISLPTTSASQVTYDDAHWEELGAKRQRKPGDDLRVYISSLKDSPVLAFKVDGTIRAPLPEVANLVLDLDQQKLWVPELSDASVVSCLGPNERLEYYHIDTPPFVDDRDFLLKTNVKVDRANRILIIESRSVTDGRKGPVEGRVRGLVHLSKYTLTDLGEGKTRLEYFVHVDPMGDIAKWLVNFAQRAYPKRTVKSLKRRIRRGASSDPSPELLAAFNPPSAASNSGSSPETAVICGKQEPSGSKTKSK